MKKTLPGWRRILQIYLTGFMLAMFFTGTLWAKDDEDQQITVSGTVISSEDSQPVPGVNIIIKGTALGTVSDSNGKYTLNVTSSDAILVFSSIGFSTQEIPVGQKSTIDVTLALDVTALSEVVVTGYGTQEKRDVTASIASVKGEALLRVSNANPLEGMKGQIAGVDVLQQNGRPGANSSITIRGRRSINASNDPLFVIDGIPMTSGTTAASDGTVTTSGSNPLNDMNPADIASVEVLKDAAATAIYGSRGANGVVLITTKRGVAGKTTVSYSGYYGVTEPFSTFPMMNGAKFANLKREANRVSPLGIPGRTAWEGTIPSDAAIFIDPVELNSVNNNISTDWQKLVFKNGSQMNHQLSVMGGTEKTQLNLSLGYFKQGGTISGMDFEKVTARINVDHNISKRFKVGMSNQFTHTVQNNGSPEVMSETVNQTPLGVPYDANGNLIFTPIGDAIRSNPLNELVSGKRVDQETVNRLFSSAYIEVEVIKGLKYKLLGGVDLRYNDRGQFAGKFTNVQKNGDPAAAFQNQSNQGYTIENLLTYNKTVGEHAFVVTGLQSIQGNNYTNHYNSVTGLPYESQLWYNLTTASTVTAVRSRYESWSLASFMGRINYTFRGRYMLQATLRSDGSSRLAPGKKWTTFPGLSAGWRIKDENFMQNIKVLTDLKLRASYGVVGNTSINPYQTQGVLAKTLYSWDEANAAGFALSQISNPNLGWEKSATVDIGLDFALFNGKLSGTFDVYQTNTTDLLLNRLIPATTGYNSVLANIGATRTQGIELTLNANIMNTPGGFRWDADFNIASYKEEIVDLAQRDAAGNKTNDPGNAWFVGQPLRVFYDYQKIGIWQKTEAGDATALMGAFPGEIKLKDQNGDGKITPDDRIVLGSDVPSAYGGLNNRFTYKGFDFSFNLYYRLGSMISSQFMTDQNTMQGRYNNLDVNYWTIDNPTNEYPKPNKVQESPAYASTLRYVDAGYVKLRTITLGYTLRASVLSKLGVSNFRIYISANNALAFTNYKLFDPEVAPPPPGQNTNGAGTVPSNKVFLGGVNITF